MFLLQHKPAHWFVDGRAYEQNWKLFVHTLYAYAPEIPKYYIQKKEIEQNKIFDFEVYLNQWRQKKKQLEKH